jgi:mRNA-degrading endonuclease toxin of MazEF toxin-antitoxin module
VVQSDARNALLTSTIVAMITKNLSRIGTDPTQVLIEVASADGRSSGPKVDSAVTCGNLFAVHESLIHKRIGTLPAPLMLLVNDGLKAALSLP